MDLDDGDKVVSVALVDKDDEAQPPAETGEVPPPPTPEPPETPPES